MVGMMRVKIPRSAVKCWPESLRKERALTDPDSLARACASEGGSGAGALAAGQAAAAKVRVLLRRSQLRPGAVRVQFNAARCEG